MRGLVQGAVACIALALTFPASADETPTPAPSSAPTTAPATWPTTASTPPATPHTQTIMVRDAEGRPVDAKLSVVEANGDRILLVTTPAPPPPPPPPPPVVAAPNGEKHEGNPWPYVLLAGGATLAATSAIFQLVAINEDSDARHYYWTSTRDDLSPSTQQLLRDSSDSNFDAAKTDQAVAITCGILAVTAVTVAVTWLVVGKR